MKKALVLGIAGAIATVIYAAIDLTRAAAAWTAAFSFGLATVLAALALVFSFYLAHAKWWLIVQRPLLACAGVTPLYAIFFVPIALLLGRIYPWASAARRASLEPEVAARVAHQMTWNHPTAFLGRAVVYFVVFIGLTLAIRRAHARSDNDAARVISGPGVPILGFAATFAFFDWVMALEPGWSSDMMGLYLLGSGLVGATSLFALATVATPEARPDHVHATGRLLLMAVILWAYIGFFQLLLLWIADEPREITFYQARASGSWAAVDWLLVIGRFAVPFVLLLSRPLKRDRRALGVVAAWSLLTTALEHAWFVLPSSGARLSLFDLAPFACIGGFSWAYGAHLFTRVPAPPPSHDLELALRYHSP